MSKDKSVNHRLIKHTLFFGIGSVLPKAISFLLIPVYAIYLDPADFGIAELCSSLGAFVVILMRLGVTGSVSRFYFDYENNPEEIRDYVTTIYRFLYVASIGVGLLVAALLYFFNEYLTPGLLFFPFVVLVLLNNFFSTNSDLQKRLLQAREKSSYMGIINICVSIVNICLTIVCVIVMDMGALGLVLSQCFTSFIFFIQAQFYLKNDIKGVFRYDFLVASFKYGRNILPHHLFVAGAPLLSKTILLANNSMDVLGIYALALKLTLPLDVLYHSFSQGFQPVYFKTRKQIDNGEVTSKVLVKLFGNVWLLATGIYLILVIVMPWLVVNFIPERYFAAIPLIPILGLGFLGQVLYLLQSSDLFYLKKVKSIPYITAVGLLVNIVITILTVNKYGHLGIAWASTAGLLTWAVMSFFLSESKFLPQPLNFLFSICAIGSVFILTTTIEDSEIIRLVVGGLIFAGIGFFLLRKKLLKL